MRRSTLDKPLDWTETLSPGQTVDLDLKNGTIITVKVSDSDSVLCYGEVVNGHWSEDSSERIDEGESIEFLLSMISCRDQV
jgi:hypothetical protein